LAFFRFVPDSQRLNEVERVLAPGGTARLSDSQGA